MARRQRTITPAENLARDLARQEFSLKEKLIDLREARGLSQRKMAELMGIDHSGVSRFERTDSNPKLSTIAAYAFALGALVKLDVITVLPTALNLDGTEYRNETTVTETSWQSAPIAIPNLEGVIGSRSEPNSRSVQYTNTVAFAYA